MTDAMAKQRATTTSSRVARIVGWLVLGCTACAEPDPPTFSFYEERIDPILRVGCAQQTTGCHVATEQGFALGNLDLSSFDALMRRRDVLQPTGPYSESLLLLKGGDPITVRVDTFDPPDPTRPEERFVAVETDIRHAGGRGIEQGSAGYSTLRQWMSIGATRSGAAVPHLRESVGSCRNGVGELPGIDPSRPIADMESYNRFVENVQPVLRASCAGGNCHGQPSVDLWLTCGDTEEELRWNYYVSLAHVSAPSSASELLRRPLANTAGGVFHEGGDVLPNTDDDRYRVLRDWVDDIVERVPEILVPTDADEGLRFFANRVQPALVREGCMFLNCHSTAMFHDLRLRGGATGLISHIATRRNYEMSRLQLATESPDPNASRIVAKNLFPGDLVDGGQGLTHRGGSLFEDFGGTGGVITHATPELCEGIDADTGDLNEVPAYCVLVRWHELERAAAIARGEVFDQANGVSAVAWVSRPLGVGRPEDFDTFRGGAELMLGAVAGDLNVMTVDAGRSLNADCGLSANVDIRAPAVSWDGTQLAFAVRTSETTPFRIYTMNADGSACAPLAPIAASNTESDGILIHDFDPAFAPDGRIVFASTRGNISGGASGGPTRTPAALAPNANLYVFDPENGNVRQLTYLLDQEISPSFMADGRVIFTTQKRGRDFHQLAGRRQNLDGGDYHPLFAQRPSVGFESATEIVELPNRNLAIVAGPIDAIDGAGTIAIVNRSIGPDQEDRDPADRTYLSSLTFPAPGAFGAMAGAFRSPAPLPHGKLFVSCDLDATTLASGPFDFDICYFDPDAGLMIPVGGAPNRADVDMVAIYGRAQHGVFSSRQDEANGATQIVPGETDAVVRYLDFPLLSTLLFSNTREGRPIDPRIGGFDVLQAEPPPSNASSFTGLSSVVDDESGQYFESLRVLGHVSLAADGSASVRLPAGVPLMLRPTDGDGRALMFGDEAPFAGEMIQREAIQFYPGERVKQALPRRFFNGLCGGCHGSITNRELDIAVNVDVLTTASLTNPGDTQDLAQ